MTQRLVLAPAAVDARVPVGVARPYASMLLEQREGQMVRSSRPMRSAPGSIRPTATSSPSMPRTGSATWCRSSASCASPGSVPRRLRPSSPTEAEIAAYYKANQATYAGSETRVISQAVVQDKQQADAIAARARSGASFVAAAAPAGLSRRRRQRRPANPRRIHRRWPARPSPMPPSPPPRARSSGRSGPTLAGMSIKIEDIRGATGQEPRPGPRRDRRAADHQQAQGSADRPRHPGRGPDRRRGQLRRGGRRGQAAGRRPPRRSTPAARSRTDAAYRFPAELQPVLKAGFAMAADDDPEVVTLPNEAGYALVAVDRVHRGRPRAAGRDQGSGARGLDPPQGDRTGPGPWRRRSPPRSRAALTMDKAVAEAGVPLPPVAADQRAPASRSPRPIPRRSRRCACCSR